MTEALEHLCEDSKVARKEYGQEVAGILQRRLTQIRAAPTLKDFTFGTPHPLKGDLHGCIGIWLNKAVRLVVRPSNDPLPLLPDGGLDRGGVTIVTVEYVGNYHD